MAQAAVCWVALPVIVAVLTTPNLGSVLRESPRDAMVRSFLLGVCYGVGGTAFGVAHTYMGFYRFTSWALHMSMLVLFSAFVGVFLNEWKGCRRTTVAALCNAFAALVVAVMFITYGSYLGGG